MDIFSDSTFVISLAVAVISVVINIVQRLHQRQVQDKIKIWAKDAKGMTTSIVGIRENIKTKKLNSLEDVSSNLETLGNFANSMYTSMEEEMGNKKKDITS